MSETIKVLLPDSEIPRQWYNLAADLPHPVPPPLGPDGQPISPQALEAVFPGNLIEQEMSQERWITIPDSVLQLLRVWRPTPLCRARRLEEALKTPAEIYFKNEGTSPPGSHKPNTAIAQAYYNKEFGIKRLITETGAGQWGSALAYACRLLGLECQVFMVRVSFDQKPFRKVMMQTWGASCLPSPSNQTEIGRKILQEQPDTPGSLGIAISEALEAAVTSKNTRYSLGSVLNHVLLHQTIIGLEAKKQFEILGTYPDVVIGCVGGGSNFAGLSFPFICDKIHGRDLRIVGVEPTACPTLTRGSYVYDAGDVAQMTPLLPMHSLGHTFVPPAIHAGGLRYHGVAPLVSQVLREKLIEAYAIPQLECYEAAVQFAQTEGFIPAPETSHAIAMAIREAHQAREEGRKRIIVFNFSGHGLMDLAGYETFFAGKLKNQELEEEELARTLEATKGFPTPPS